MSRWERVRLLAGGVVTAWALWNAAAVYLIFAGEKQHRLETALLLLVAYAVLSEIVTRTLRSPGPAGDAPQLDAATCRALMGLALVLWLAIVIAAAGVPFLSDDYVLLARYRDSAAHAPQQFFRPVFGVVFWALSAVGGEATWPFRLASAGLHVGSALLVSRLTTRVTGSPTAGTIGFVVFLLNPLQGEAVIWIAGLQETLWTFLALGALTVHARDDWRPALRIGAVAVLSGLAFGAKETAAGLLLLLPALDVVTGRPLDRTRLAVYAVVALEFAAYLALRSRSLAFESGVLGSPTRYAVKQFVVLPYQFYQQPWSTAAIAMPGFVSFATAALGVAGVAWTLIGRRRWRWPLAGAFVILASTLPLTAYFFVRDDLAGARYLYFGAFGWGLIVAAALAAALRSARAVAAATAVAAVILAATLHVNLRPWRQAAAIVGEMERAATRGENAAAAGVRTADRLGIQLMSRDGIPREAGGVGLFINGYPEFLARIHARTSPAAR
jgi:hypothetical protein